MRDQYSRTNGHTSYADLLKYIYFFTAEPHPGFFPGRLGVGRTAVAFFDMNGVNGTVQLYQEHRDAPVLFHVNLDGLDQYPAERFPWHVHMYPVDFSLLKDFPCSLSAIGDHYDPFGVAVGLPVEEYDANCRANVSLCEIGDFSRKLGFLTTERWQSFTDPNLSLFGPLTPIGRSLLIHRGTGERWICSNFELHGVKILSLKYNFVSGPFEGDVVIRRVEGRDESKILVDIHKTAQLVDQPLVSVNHRWGLRKFAENSSAIGENCTGVGKVSVLSDLKKIAIVVITHSYTYIQGCLTYGCFFVTDLWRACSQPSVPGHDEMWIFTSSAPARMLHW